MKSVRKRLTYANVMSSIAVFLVLGGATAFAASTLGKNTVGSKQLKKNAVTAAKIKNGAVTGAKLKLSTVGKVPSAGTADTATNATNAQNAQTAQSAVNATNAQNANRAASVDSVIPFSVGANAESMVTLAKTANFELMGICDPAGTFDPPGVQFENTGTAVVIYNRGSVPAFADSSDDENYKMGLNEGVVFNYDDNEDGGMAMSTDGHFLSAPAWANEQADIEDKDQPNPGDSYPFPTTCHFAGAALVG